jgi:hypothetical protein
MCIMRQKWIFRGLFAIALASIPAGASAQMRKSVSLTEHNRPIVNPYMGWGLWAGPRYYDGRTFPIEYNTTGFGDDAPLFKWVLIDWMWSDLEPQEGRYHWNDLDTILDFWGERGKQLYLRVWITDDPGWNGAPGNEVCPEWLWASGARFRAYTGESNSKKREPDYLDPSYEKIYLPKARRFLSALAARYDRPDSPVILWGAMGYGQWGEWHTMWSHYPWPGRDVKHAALARIVEMYEGIFKVRPVMISYCFDDDLKQVTSLEDFLYRQALDLALSKGFALARHGFIDGLLLYDYLTMEKYWPQAAMLAEGDWSYMDVKDHGTHGTMEENIAVMEQWHSNYGHFYMDAESYRRAMHEDRGVFENGLRNGGIGYRLALLEASWPEELHAGDLLMIQSRWVNRNSGRLYVRHPLRIYLTDADGNEKFSAPDRAFTPVDWVAGKEYPVTTLITLSSKLEPGIYDLRAALTDPDSGKPSIRLAIEGEDSRMRYRLGTIRILPSRSGK